MLNEEMEIHQFFENVDGAVVEILYIQIYLHVVWMIEMKGSDKIYEDDTKIILKRFLNVVIANRQTTASPPAFSKEFITTFTNTLNSMREESLSIKVNYAFSRALFEV